MESGRLKLETLLVDLPAYGLPRIGRKTADQLAVEIAANCARPDPREATVEDLLQYLPMRYEDRSNLTRIEGLSDGLEASVEVIVRVGGVIPLKGGRLRLYEFVGGEESGVVTVRAFWWNQVYLNRVFRPGMRVILYGVWKLNRYKGSFEIENPEYEIMPEMSRGTSGEADDEGESGAIHTARRVPVYRKLGEFRTRQLRSIYYRVLEALGEQIPESLPEEMVRRCGLMSRGEAVREVHFPEAGASVGASVGASIDDFNRCSSPAHRRLIFEEFFWLAIALGVRRLERVREPKGAIIEINDRVREAVRRILPFELTGAQRRVVAEIAADMAGNEPMNRLVQGDVGSGKTIVALQAMIMAIENGYQAALMAPTEILAEQHGRNIARLLTETPYRVALLTGSLKAKEKRAIHESLRSGEIHLVVGTHALIQEGVEFSRLGLVVIDEQHRFGVLQRAGIRRRGVNPDVLVMTATPIPRSLAMTVYGDLDVSVIDELPPGRTPISTHVRGDDRRERIYEFIRAQMAAGRQAYVVYPIVEESEKLDLRNATEMFETLRRDIFPEFRVGLLHGKLKPAEKEAAMKAFTGRETSLLVATTVVEVGVDVPNATVMLIEHAERFGLSQLHQLRGRVGRGGGESFCILLAQYAKTREARERLKIMEETSDGFLIAEKDLEIRGPGELMGTRQSGIPTFRLANLVRDQSLLDLARREADYMLGERALTHETDRLIRRVRSEPRYGLAEIG